MTPEASGTGQPSDALDKAIKATVLENTLRIAGEAPDSLIIAVKVNDRLAAAGTPKAGVFVFEAVPLQYGENEISLYAVSLDGRSTLLQRMTAAYGKPVPAFLARDVSRGRLDRRQLALTFDGGSGAAAAEPILDILREKRIKCTIFLTGGFIKRYPQLVRRMAEDGHEIGNHTWSHPHLTTFAENGVHQTRPGITREKLQQELKRTADLFQQVTGRRMAPLWRAPYGEHNEEIRRWAAEAGYLQIGWTVGKGETLDTMDWVSDSTLAAFRSPEQILEKVLGFGQSDGNGANGGIILMHLDSQRRGKPVYTILEALIDSMTQRGYRFATVSELINP